MSDFLGMEHDGRRFPRDGADPEVIVLCGIAFFSSYLEAPLHRLEPYAREFVPAMCEAAQSCSVDAFLPRELSQLTQVCDRLSQFPPEVTGSWNLNILRSLSESPAATTHAADNKSNGLRCLFVDYYDPAFGLEPRGRILNLMATATPMPRSAREDVVTVHNPVRQVDDSFLEQAAISVKVARNYLVRNHKLSSERRYRMDFRIDATKSQFTGDSIGVAFGVSAVAAIAKLEMLRCQFTISQDTAFTGALRSDGSVRMIDGEGIRLKVERAWQANLRAIAVPNEHLVDAVRQAQMIRGESSSRQLDVVGASSFEDVMRNPLFVSHETTPLWKWSLSAFWRSKRSVWIEIPVLSILLAVLAYVILGLLNRTPKSVEYTEDRFQILNRFGFTLWSKEFPGVQLKDARDQLSDLCQFTDINDDGKPEVLLFLPTKNAVRSNARLFVYNERGDTLFTRFCGVCRQYPTDSLSEDQLDFYECGRVRVVTANDRKLIYTEIMKNEPGRGYIRLWSTAGDSLGWYINSGGTTFIQVADVDHDGSDELIVFGFNNRLNCVTVLALPTDSLWGVGPPYEVNSRGYDLSRVERGNHKICFAFPPTDVWRAIGRMDYQGGLTVQVKADEMVVATNEALDDGGAPIHARYHISPNFEVTGVSLDDSFSTLRRRLIAAGKVPDVPESAYCRNLQEQVLEFRP